MMTFTIIYTTNPDIKTAKKIANHLLKKKLIACANYFPIESSYWWNEKIENSKEIVAILKTSSKNIKIIENEIKKLHPYEVPCIIRINAKANTEYKNWIIKNSNKKLKQKKN